MNYGYIPNWTKALSQNVIYNFPISTLSSHSRAHNSEMFWSLDMRIVSCSSKFMQMTYAQFHNNLIRNVKEVCSKFFVTMYGDQPIMADRAHLTNSISNIVCKGKRFFTQYFSSIQTTCAWSSNSFMLFSEMFPKCKIPVINEELPLPTPNSATPK